MPLKSSKNPRIWQLIPIRRADRIPFSGKKTKGTFSILQANGGDNPLNHPFRVANTSGNFRLGDSFRLNPQNLLP